MNRCQTFAGLSFVNWEADMQDWNPTQWHRSGIGLCSCGQAEGIKARVIIDSESSAGL